MSAAAAAAVAVTVTETFAAATAKRAPAAVAAGRIKEMFVEMGFAAVVAAETATGAAATVELRTQKMPLLYHQKLV